jgi:PBSX family phage terminase large subunit
VANPRRDSFRFRPFSPKQTQVLTWWLPSSPHRDRDALICDGSVRGGKTLAMSLSFVIWSLANFDGENFAFCGKTIATVRRNVILPLRRMLAARGYRVDERRANNSLTIRRRGRSNEFYLFGGRDERSQDLIQGVTLAGVFFDEVALQPESFVNQATARCSVENSKFWFNCNPAGPYHWFKTGWLDQIEQKNALHLHFTLEDNWSLSEHTRARYRSLYSGVFYQRYILGRWVAAEGRVFDQWDLETHTYADSETPPGLFTFARRYVGVDYGTQNATVFLDCWDDGKTLWVVDEYYHSGRESGRQKEDSEYAQDLLNFAGSAPVRFVVVDPSAASFKVALRHRGMHTRDAQNDVIDGIRTVSTLLATRRLRVNRDRCPNLVREITGYVWDEKALARGVEQPLKQSDHAVDALRYLCHTIVIPRRLNAA